MSDWIYYNHAVIPKIAPHKSPDTKCIQDGSVWKIRGGGIPMLARWTTEFDCAYETSWWYVIKDAPFDISNLKAKRRCEINKGKKNFTVSRIKPSEYAADILKVHMEALSSWPKKYRPTVCKEKFVESITTWDAELVYGGFDNDTNELCGYALLHEHSQWLEFSMLRVIPSSEKRGINAAIVAGILEDNNSRLNKNFYINDGSRAVRHETAFQDYLEKYFGFRKAYCQLHILYRFPLNIVVKILYPLRDRFKDEGRIGSLICSILKMEELQRVCRRSRRNE